MTTGTLLCLDCCLAQDYSSTCKLFQVTNTLSQREGGELDSHPGWITLLLSNLRMITIIPTAGIQKTAAVSRKALLELMPHSNKIRIPRQKASAGEGSGYRKSSGYRKTAL